MDREERNAWVRLLLTDGVGNDTARKLLTAFGSPQAVWAQSHSALKAVTNARIADALTQVPGDLAPTLERLEQWLGGGEHRHLLSLGDPAYPAELLQTADPPLLLHVMGRLEALRHPQRVAIVGSRNPTPQGALNAHAFALALGQAGVCVVSGLALGVDGAAHEGALEAGAPTIAVVGTGLDRVYPKPPQRPGAAHRRSTACWSANTRSARHRWRPIFRSRNRIISGLAQGTPGGGSGAAVGFADHRAPGGPNRGARCSPSPVRSTRPRPGAAMLLIRQGAKLVESAQDILEDLHLVEAFGPANPRHKAPISNPGSPRQPCSTPWATTRSAWTPCKPAPAWTTAHAAGQVAGTGTRWRSRAPARRFVSAVRAQG